MVGIFSSYFPELVRIRNNSSEFVIRNFVELVKTNSLDLAAKNSLELVIRNSSVLVTKVLKNATSYLEMFTTNSPVLGKTL